MKLYLLSTLGNLFMSVVFFWTMQAATPKQYLRAPRQKPVKKVVLVETHISADEVCVMHSQTTVRLVVLFHAAACGFYCILTARCLLAKSGQKSDSHV